MPPQRQGYYGGPGNRGHWPSPDRRKELAIDQEKNPYFEARLSRLITGAGKKNNII